MEDKLIEKIYIDEKSEELIRFTLKQYRVMAVLWIAISLVSFTISIQRIIKYYNYRFNDWIDLFNLEIHSVCFLITTALGIYQLYCYYNGIKFQNRAITESNQGLFTKSYTFYVRGNYLSIIIISINLVINLVLLYQQV